MDRVVLTSQIGADGILHVTVPFAPAEAHREVRVTIDEAPARKEEMSREEWHAWVMAHAGACHRGLAGGIIIDLLAMHPIPPKAANHS